MDLTAEQIFKAFTYYPPKDDQPARYEILWRLVKDFALYIHENVPESKEKDLAMVNLENAVMWANAAIARNE